MSELSAPVPGASGVTDPEATQPRHQSLLFPSLCSRLPRGRRLNVFDVGPAFPETLRFFSEFPCRLHFADLYADPLVLQGSSHLEDSALREALARSMAIPAGTLFDLVLLWDFPNYIDDRALLAFSEVLRPHLGRQALGHGFAVRTPETRIRNQWYGIDQPHLFTVRQPDRQQARFHPHSQAILINLLTCFDIERGMLLPDGRLEVLLQAN